MSTVSRPDIAKLQEDLGPKIIDRIRDCSDQSVSEDLVIKPPQGVPMNTDPPIATGTPANEIVLDMPVLVIRFGRGKCIVQDPIGTIVAIDDSPSKIKDGSSSLELANLLREALTSTTKIEFNEDAVPDVTARVRQLTFTETRAISDAIVKWSVELGKP